MATFTDLEARARNVAVYITETWSEDGQEVAGFRAVATGDDREVASVSRNGRLTTVDDLAELLAALAHEIAKADAPC